MTATVSPALRIGEVAKLAGTTPRTIRYYEEIGLLHGGGAERPSGQHRLYTEGDVERLREVIRLKELLGVSLEELTELLGVSLEELTELLEVEEARASLRQEWHEQDPEPARRREILLEGLGHLEQQLALVRRRRSELESLAGELESRRRKLRRRLRELS